MCRLQNGNKKLLLIINSNRRQDETPQQFYDINTSQVQWNHSSSVVMTTDHIIHMLIIMKFHIIVDYV